MIVVWTLACAPPERTSTSTAPPITTDSTTSPPQDTRPEPEDTHSLPTTSGTLAIGDSIFDWNRYDSASIPDVIGQERNETVVNSSWSGARLDAKGGADIRGQYTADPWSWVVMNGGINDLGQCGCAGYCDDLLDALISRDGTTGVLPEFLATITVLGTRVAILGYPTLPPGAAFGFDPCDEELVELSARQARLAATDARIDFVDANDVIDPETLKLFDSDLVHPSVAGSQAMGELIARHMNEAEKR